ncbi:MAG: hypothetical protein EA387_09240 [Nitriliruptor sp.]|nr:MAG: hypothetical protein EA387_09240 [Nitriliruptor sp.]
MTSIDIVPAGIQLYEVEVSDDSGTSRHHVGMPDRLLAELDLDDVAAQDVVRVAVEFLVEREGRDRLAREIDLGSTTERYPELEEQLTSAARARASRQTPPPGLHDADPDAPTGDRRLVAEVEQEQRAGEASRPFPHR